MPPERPPSLPRVPIAQIDEHGRSAPFGTLTFLPEQRFLWEEPVNGQIRSFDGLPWFLEDLHPHGFMGRAFSREDHLAAWHARGTDPPGNLVLGLCSSEQSASDRATSVSQDCYPALAKAAIEGLSGKTWVGGEQPKFCCVRGTHPVIVKFSPAGNAASDQRWRDLLICEHLALETLRGAGVHAAESAASEAGGRVFLEVERFDRTREGRIGMVSLLAYDAEYIGQMDNWADTAARMAARGLLTEEDADRLRLLEAFGRLIGNTDRHYGNVSLIRRGKAWALAPAYDMLPMIYAPIASEIVPRDSFDPGQLQPTSQTLQKWDSAVAMARRFWRAAATDTRISAAFRKLCASHARQLSAE